jgi:hypothetical protein
MLCAERVVVSRIYVEPLMEAYVRSALYDRHQMGTDT